MEQLPIEYRNSGKLLDDAKFIIETARAVAYRSVNVALVITPGKVDHDPVWDYPLEAIRETLANAICHRDYGAPYDIQVKVFEDPLRISSPGQLAWIKRHGIYNHPVREEEFSRVERVDGAETNPKYTIFENVSGFKRMQEAA